MVIRHCVCCDQSFEPRPQVPNQAFCSSSACQRARKRQWQQAKLQSDQDYQNNQRAAQRAWSKRNENYWRIYRKTHPENQQGNREQQKIQDKSSKIDFAKMDACNLLSGIYQIIRIPDFSNESGTSWIVEITPLDIPALARWMRQERTR